MSLKREDLVAKALEMLKQDGIDGISLRKLAGELNIKAASLYTHVKNKRDLIDEMAEAILQKEFTDLTPRKDEERWQDWLSSYALRLRKSMLAYPDGGRLVTGAHFYPAVTLLKIIECALDSLVNDGVDITQARHMVMTVTYYTFGYVIEEQSDPTTEERAKIDTRAFFAPYPHMSKLVEMARSHTSSEDDFLTGLRLIIS